MNLLRGITNKTDNNSVAQMYNPSRGESLRCIDGNCRVQEAGPRIRFDPDANIVKKSSSRDSIGNSSDSLQKRSRLEEPVERDSSGDLNFWKDKPQKIEIERLRPAHSSLQDNTSADNLSRESDNRNPVSPPSKLDISSGYSAYIAIPLFATIGLFVARKASRLLRSIAETRFCDQLQKILDSRPSYCVYALNNHVAKLISCQPSEKPGFAHLRLLQLEYAEESPLKTMSIHLDAEMPIKSLHQRARSMLMSRYFITNPPIIPIRNSQWRRVDPESRYCEFVLKHHYYWAERIKVSRLRSKLTAQLDLANANSSKYIDSQLFAEGYDQISDFARCLHREIDRTSEILRKINGLIEMLTMTIESIEDFGGLLLGYETPIDLMDRHSDDGLESASMDVDRDIEMLSLEAKALEGLSDRI